jgi:uncharacterized membrane protein YuzA (DUF378 family)
MGLLDNGTTKAAAWLVSAVGAANWGLVELMNTNLLTDVLMLGSDLEGIGYIVVGIAGVLSLADFFTSDASGDLL